MERKELTDLCVEEMKEDDLVQVVEIERASCASPWSESLFFNEIKNPNSIPVIARRDGKIAGYLCASRILDEGHILNLAVHPGFRRQGIASALLDSMIGRLRDEGCISIFLEVRLSNEEARSIYEKFNFRIIGIRKDYYAAPVEDAAIMVLKLGLKIPQPQVLPSGEPTGSQG